MNCIFQTEPNSFRKESEFFSKPNINEKKSIRHIPICEIHRPVLTELSFANVVFVENCC